MYGQYEHALDTKNRVIIPKALRDPLADGLVMTRGYDTCICVYPPDKWQALQKRMDKLSRADARVRAFARLYVASACETILDKMGRVVLPPYLREYAQIDKDTIILGLSTTIEIWSAERFKEQLEIDLENAQSILETVAEMGI